MMRMEIKPEDSYLKLPWSADHKRQLQIEKHNSKSQKRQQQITKNTTANRKTQP